MSIVRVILRFTLKKYGYFHIIVFSITWCVPQYFFIFGNVERWRFTKMHGFWRKKHAFFGKWTLNLIKFWAAKDTFKMVAQKSFFSIHHKSYSLVLSFWKFYHRKTKGKYNRIKFWSVKSWSVFCAI